MNTPKPFEHHSEPLLPKHLFFKRLRNNTLKGIGILFASLFFGMAGFHILAEQSWIDALVNSAMLLGGMGPVGDIQSVVGKLFASFFALFAGIIFLAVVTLLFAPVYHRFLHKFHLEEEHRKKEKTTS